MVHPGAANNAARSGDDGGGSCHSTSLPFLRVTLASKRTASASVTVVSAAAGAAGGALGRSSAVARRSSAHVEAISTAGRRDCGIPARMACISRVMEGDRATGDPNLREIWVSEDQPMAWHQREGEFDLLRFSAEVAVDLAIGMNQAHVQMWAAPLDLIGLSVASSLGLVRTMKISAGCCFIHPRLVFVASRKDLRRLPGVVGSSPSAVGFCLPRLDTSHSAKTRREVPTSSPPFPTGKGNFCRPSQVVHQASTISSQVRNHQIRPPASGWGCLNYFLIRFSFVCLFITSHRIARLHLKTFHLCLL